MVTKRFTPIYSLGNSHPVFTTQYLIDNEIIFFLEAIKNDTKIWPAVLDLLYYLTEKLFTAGFMLQLGDNQLMQDPAEDFRIYTPGIRDRYLYDVIEPGVKDWERRWYRPRTVMTVFPDPMCFILGLSSKEVGWLQGNDVFSPTFMPHASGTVYEIMRRSFCWEALKIEMDYFRSIKCR